MKAWLAQYNKLWAGLAGLALLFFLKRLDLEILGLESAIVEIVVSAVTGWSIFQVTNPKPVDPAAGDDFRGV